MRNRFLFYTTAILMAAGCSHLQQPEPESSDILTLNATLAECDVTRTELNKYYLDSHSWQGSFSFILWNPSDELNVFSGARSGKFVCISQSGSFGERAAFNGKLEGPYGEPSSPAYWAFYPYSPDNVFDGESISFSLPSEQAAYRGSFSPGLYPHLAVGNSLDNMSFRNICGGACFGVTRNNIHSVVFRSNGGEPLAGKVRCGIDESGVPVIKEVVEGVDSVVVSSSPNVLVPDNRWFYYFAVMLPQTLENGLTITIRTTDGKALYIPVWKPVDIKRSVFGYMQDMDLYAQGGDISVVIIKDMNLRAPLTKAFDTDNDGLLSFSEAEAVSANSLFSVLERIYITNFGDIGAVCKSFEEFRFFTGVDSIPYSGFENWAKATRIDLPESIRSIGPHAFASCTALTDLTIPAHVQTIGTYAFDSCHSLAWVVMKPTTPPVAGELMFFNTGTFPIYVPDASVNLYKEADNWTPYASRIRPMSEFSPVGE